MEKQIHTDNFLLRVKKIKNQKINALDSKPHIFDGLRFANSNIRPTFAFRNNGGNLIDQLNYQQLEEWQSGRSRRS